MLVHSIASKYARFVVLVGQMYWTPPSDHWTPPLLKSDDLFLGNQEILDPPPFKNPGHAPVFGINIRFFNLMKVILNWRLDLTLVT